MNLNKRTGLLALTLQQCTYQCFPKGGVGAGGRGVRRDNVVNLKCLNIWDPYIEIGTNHETVINRRYTLDIVSVNVDV